MPGAVERPETTAQEKYEALLTAVQAYAVIEVAVAHPFDAVSLKGAVASPRAPTPFALEGAIFHDERP